MATYFADNHCKDIIINSSAVFGEKKELNFLPLLAFTNGKLTHCMAANEIFMKL